MKKIFGVIALIFFLIATLGIFYFQISQAKNETVANWGIADAKEINVNSKVSGRILEIFVDEGDAVKKNQILAKIDQDFQEPQKNLPKHKSPRKLLNFNKF